MLIREQAGAVTDPQRKILEDTAKACARLGAVVAEMSDLARIESGDIVVAGAPFDLAALVVDLGGRLTEGEDRGLRLEVRVTGPLPVTGDRVRLAAAITALMHVVLRERDSPGVVVVECSARPDAGQTWAIVTIGDESITEGLLHGASHVSPHFDEWREGLGLALPVGRRVIEAHGGAVWSVRVGAAPTGSALRLPLAPQVSWA
jgi:signal transduction histidine kinase